MAYSLDYSKILVSRQVYEVEDGYTVKYMWPLKDSGSVQTIPFRKRKCQPYDDATSVTQCIGLAEKEVIAKPTDEDDIILKPTWMNREIGVVYWGEVRLTNMKSGFTANPWTKIAPYPSGMTEWETDMSKLGYALADIPYGQTGLCFVELGS